MNGGEEMTREELMALLIACSVFVARGGTPKKLIASLERGMEAVKK